LSLRALQSFLILKWAWNCWDYDSS